MVVFADSVLEVAGRMVAFADSVLEIVGWFAELVVGLVSVLVEEQDYLLHKDNLKLFGVF